MPLTSAYWPLPLTAVVQSVFMVVLLASSMETPAEDQDSVCASNSSVPLGKRGTCGKTSVPPYKLGRRGTTLLISARSRRAMLRLDPDWSRRTSAVLI